MLKKRMYFLGFITALFSVVSYGANFTQMNFTKNDVGCSENGIKGCNFLGEWTGTCESDPALKKTLNFNGVGYVDYQDLKDYFLYIGDVRYSLNYTNTNIYTSLFSQKTTHSAVRLLNENKLTLTSTEVEHITREAFSDRNFITTDTETVFEISGDSLVKTVVVKSEWENQSSSDKCTYKHS